MYYAHRLRYVYGARSVFPLIIKLFFTGKFLKYKCLKLLDTFEHAIILKLFNFYLFIELFIFYFWYDST